MYEKRPYQQRVIAEVKASLNAGKNTLISLPTGAGKAFILATVASDLLAAYPSFRVLIIVDRQILTAQLQDTVKSVAPGVTVGLACSGVSKKIDTTQQVTIATRQTMQGVLDSCDYYNLLIADEAHLWRLQEDGKPPQGQFAEIYARLMEYNPKMRLLGCSATCYSLQAGYIYGKRNKIGFNPYFDELTSQVTFEELIKDGYLSRSVGKVIDNDIDLSNVGMVAGEYNLGELSGEMVKHIGTIDKAITDFCEGRKKILVFAVDIKHAELIQDRIANSTLLHSKLSQDEAAKNLDSFCTGHARVIISVNQLSIGFDHNAVDAVILARPSSAPALILQQIGRGLRTAPGKDNCLIIDLVGVTKQHFVNNSFDMPIVKIPLPGGKGDAPYKFCPGVISDGQLCQEQLHPKVCLCPFCGFRFEDAIADDLPAMKKVDFNAVFVPDDPEWFDVVDLSIDMHTSRKNGKELLKVTLSLDTLDRFSNVMEWICLPDQYEGYSLVRGKEAWEKYTTTPIPDNVGEALWIAQGDFKKPSRALVCKDKKGYWQLKKIDFDEEVELTDEELDSEIPF